MGDGGVNKMSFSLTYTNNDGSICTPCLLCEGSALSNVFDPNRASLCVSCTGNDSCNEATITNSFHKAWGMTYTSFVSHEGDVSLDPDEISILASDDYDEDSDSGTWNTLATSSAALLFQQRNVPQHILFDNSIMYRHYRIVFRCKDNSNTMKIGHVGIVQSYTKTYAVQTFEKITKTEVLGLPTKVPTTAPSNSPSNLPTGTPTTASTLPQVNVALQGVASQSTTWNGRVASKAIDGITNESGTHTDNKAFEWWRVDLNDNYAIGKVAIWNRSDCCTERLSGSKVEILNSMGDVVDTKTIGDVNGIYYIEFEFDGIIGKSVKITKTIQKVLSLAEVQVYAAVPNPFGPSMVGFCQNVNGSHVGSSSARKKVGTYSNKNDCLMSCYNYLVLSKLEGEYISGCQYPESGNCYVYNEDSFIATSGSGHVQSTCWVVENL